MNKTVGYTVDSPFTDVENGKFYRFVNVEFEKIEGLIVTKTGKQAKYAVICRIHRYGQGKANYGQSVCHPIDKFKFWKGAKYALARALDWKDGTRYTKEMRNNIWAGFFMLFPKARK